MREIKFRVWDKINKGWLRYKEIIIGWQHPLNGDSKPLKDWAFVSPDGQAFNSLQYCIDSKGFEVVQYTGLKDKNGKEIYEGDILATKFFPAYAQRIRWNGPPEAICELCWDYTRWGLRARGEKDHRYPGLHELNLLETEIIGNIYENPELLK